MPTPALARAAKRMLRHNGEDATVTNFTDDGTRDKYEDPAFTTSTTATTGIFRAPYQPSDSRSQSGEQIDYDVKIWLIEGVGVYAPDDRTKASRITREATGNTYKVHRAWPEGNGLTAILATVVDDD